MVAYSCLNDYNRHSVHKYPYSCTGPTALIFHNLLGNTGKTHHYLGYSGTAGLEGRKLLSCGVWILRYCSPHKSLTQSCDWRRSAEYWILPPGKRNFSGTKALCWYLLGIATSKFNELGLIELFEQICAFWAHCWCWGVGQQWLPPVIT